MAHAPDKCLRFTREFTLQQFAMQPETTIYVSCYSEVLVPTIIVPCRQRLGQVTHPTLEFASTANQVSMKVGASLVIAGGYRGAGGRNVAL